MLASLLNVAHTVGYPLLFLAVMAESGGAPVPGETSLITGAVLASRGRLELELVIIIAATAAIVGDNIGYLIGRKGGRWLLERPGAFHRQRLRVLATGEPFFERHGPKAVFFGRFVLGLRVWASWLAGANRMRWRSFLFWNACGGICWAVAIGVIAYALGRSAENLTEAFGFYGLVAFALALGGLLFIHYRNRREANAAGGDDEERARNGDRPGAGRRGGAKREKVPALTSEGRPQGRPRSDRSSGTVRYGSTSR
jgi:membrane protein DedA with SNARE-associated domain